MMMHLVPEIIINICDRLKSGDLRENERQNLFLRLDAIQEYISSVRGNARRQSRIGVEPLRRIER